MPQTAACADNRVEVAFLGDRGRHPTVPLPRDSRSHERVSPTLRQTTCSGRVQYRNRFRKMLLWVGGNCGFLSFKSASEHANQASDRQRAGVVPTNLRKTIVKWLWSEKPRRFATSANGSRGFLSRGWAHSLASCRS